MIEEKEISKIISNLADKFYNDTLQPPAQELGYVMGRIAHSLRIVGLIGLVGDAAVIAEKILKEKMENFLYDSFSKTPNEKRVLPDPTIICPLLENVANSFNKEDIVKLYSNLLSAATNKDTIEKVHPAFINIITQLTPLDAEVFSKLDKRFYLTVCRIYNDELKDTYILSQNIYLDKNYSEVDTNISISINNLERLGLIQKEAKSPYIFEINKNEPVINQFKQTKYYENECLQYGEKNINIFTQKAYISELGIAFKNICFENE